jgi:predicted DNA-binding protein with PD1-like motif
MKVVPLRLQPGDDLRRALEAWMGEQEEQAGCVISAVGSLSLAQLRLAGATEATVIRGELEILSLSGTLSPDGAHLHIAIADSSGVVIGGHLCAGSLVRTTAELVIGLLAEWRFNRELDPATGYAELRVKAQPPGPAESWHASRILDRQVGAEGRIGGRSTRWGLEGERAKVATGRSAFAISECRALDADWSDPPQASGAAGGSNRSIASWGTPT